MALGPPHDGLAVTALGPLQEWSAPWPLAHRGKGLLSLAFGPLLEGEGAERGERDAAPSRLPPPGAG